MSASVAAARVARVRADLAAQGLDGLLVTSLPNVRYLTGFSGSNAFLLLGVDLAVFLTDGRYEQQADQELAGEVGLEIQVSRNGALAAVAERIDQEFAGATLGFEGQHVSFSQWRQLDEEASAVELKAVFGMVEALRAVKDEDEINALEEAAGIAARALRETLALVRPGISEADIAAELDYRMVRLGADCPAFETIVASGERTALPHAATSRKRVEEGELLLCDLGARWQGYHSDLTRTFVVGEASRVQAERYELVLNAQSAACLALHEGATASDVDATARAVFERAGVESRFSHSTGHGVGLEVHEGPRLGKKSEDGLKSNMVVTVEPGLYFPGWGGIRIEDDVVVSAGSPRELVDLEKDRLLSLPL